MKKKTFPAFNRRNKRAEERHHSIVQAAINVLKRKGYEQTTMQDIAEAADLSPSSVYYYFDSKVAILESALNELTENIAAATQEIISAENPQQYSLTKFLLRMNDFQDANVLGLLAEAEHNPELRQRIEKMLQGFRRELMLRMLALNEKGLTTEVEPEIAVEMILSIGLGTLTLSKFSQPQQSTLPGMSDVLTAFNTMIIKNDNSPAE